MPHLTMTDDTLREGQQTTPDADIEKRLRKVEEHQREHDLAVRRAFLAVVRWIEDKYPLKGGK